MLVIHWHKMFTVLSHSFVEHGMRKTTQMCPELALQIKIQKVLYARLKQSICQINVNVIAVSMIYVDIIRGIVYLCIFMYILCTSCVALKKTVRVLSIGQQRLCCMPQQNICMQQNVCHSMHKMWNSTQNIKLIPHSQLHFCAGNVNWLSYIRWNCDFNVNVCHLMTNYTVRSRRRFLSSHVKSCWWHSYIAHATPTCATTRTNWPRYPIG